MTTEPLRFYDTTLRDGLRNSGISMTIDERIEVALGLERAGIDAIEVGYGGPQQPPVMRAIAEALTYPIVYGLSRVSLRDVDRVLEGVAPAASSGATIYLPCSEQFLAAAGLTREQGVSQLAGAIRHARSQLDHVMFASQDTTRADQAFLEDVCDTALDCGATTISISDTISHALPSEFGDLCAVLLQRPRAHEVSWSVHCHNSLGLAVANALAAVTAGVRQVEGTMNGIGEDAGNAPIQALAGAIRSRSDAFPQIHLSLATQQLREAADTVTRITER